MGDTGLPSDIMIDQLRAIDNRRLVKKIGTILPAQAKKVKENLRIVLDL
jgi:mRNA interferase MazF